MINGINFANIKTYKSNNTNNKTSNDVSFTGLKKRYEKDVYVSSSYLQSLTGVYPNSHGIVGELPIKIINKVKETNPSDLSSSLRDVQGVLAEGANIMRNAEEKKANINFDTLMRDYLDLKLEGNEEAAQKLKNAVQTDSWQPKEFLGKIEDDASAKLKQGLTDLSLLDEDDTVEVKHIGSGQFGEAFSVDFKNKEGDSKFDKYVMKIYKDSDKLDKINADFQQKLTQYTSSKDYLKLISEYNTPENPNVSYDLYQFTMDLRSNQGFPSQLHKHFQNTNGINAEANAAKYLEKQVGNVEKTDLIQTYFFDLNNNYSFVRMADESLPKPSTHIDLKKFGLVDNDFKDENLVQGRLIDMGSIVHYTPQNVKGSNENLRVLVNDKIARRTYNKIRRMSLTSKDNARQEYAKLQQQAAEKKNLAERKSILTGLELASGFIK